MTSNVPYNEIHFRQLIDECLEQTQKILHCEKRLSPLDGVAHKYEDKYRVADFLVMSAIACYLNCFSKLGLSSSDLSKLVSWSQCLDVTLSLEVKTKCVFVKETQRELKNTSAFQTETSGQVMFSLTTSKVITTVTEYHYLFTARYELVAYRGLGDCATDRIVLQSRSCEQEIVTTSETCPYSGSTNKHFEQNISWLLRRIDMQLTRATFSIDRNRDDCHTPARNKDITEASSFFHLTGLWCNNVEDSFRTLFKVQQDCTSNHVKQDISAINIEGVFVPVLPLVNDNEHSASSSHSHLMSEPNSQGLAGIEQPTSDGASTEPISGGTNSIDSNESPMMLTDASVNQLLSEQARSLQVKLDSLIPLFPPSTGKAIISDAEAKLLVTLDLMKTITSHLLFSVMHIENMLRSQLVAAVGKTLQPSDFAAYMRYHNRKLFKDEFQPRPFSHAVRRTAQHSPEGSIRIEEQAGYAMTEPIHTACCSRSASSAAPMQFALNASTNVKFRGDRHLHTYLADSFSGEAPPSLRLVAQARRFSCFIVLVGCIVSAKVFEPKYAMIVQNNDEITIPLILEQIPTPKQFRDAIESLSPEQQRFAKAFRGMQLESTLFGVLVLQIKPQLEIVLKLSTDTLTKEIQLTQDLMEMFIKYQIPSDLLSFEEIPSADASQAARLSAVRQHAGRAHEMISSSVNKDVKEQEVIRAYKGGSNTHVPCGFGAPMAFGAPAFNLAPKNQNLPSAVAFGCPAGGSSSNFGQFSVSGNVSGFGCGGFGAPVLGNPVLGSPFGSLPSVSSAFGGFGVPSGETGVNGFQACAASSTSSTQADGGRDSKTDSAIMNRYAVANQNDMNCNESPAAEGLSIRDMVDYTKFPGMLEKRYEELDSDSVLRPTIIKPGNVWSKKSFKSLISEAETKKLHLDDQVLEKNAAFDLIDALSKSGALVMHSASLHVVIAATHCFDKSLMDTVVKGNINPIERVERSALIMASTIHELPACDLISENQQSRVLTHSPQLEKRKSL